MTNAERENRIFAELVRHVDMRRAGRCGYRSWDEFVEGYEGRDDGDMHQEWYVIVLPLISSRIPE